ncbi:hypothetical protein OG21DRAFT_1407584, partial [Imleria badia]
RPFKHAAYTKNTNRHTKNANAVSGPSATGGSVRSRPFPTSDVSPSSQTRIPRSKHPHGPYMAPTSPRYCGITGLDVRPHTDRHTGLRFHDKRVCDLIKNLSPGVAKDYLSARGVNPIIK